MSSSRYSSNGSPPTSSPAWSSSSTDTSPPSSSRLSTLTTANQKKASLSHLSGFQNLDPNKLRYSTMPPSPLSPDQHLNATTPTSRIVFSRDEMGMDGLGSAGFTEGENATRGLLGASLKQPSSSRYPTSSSSSSRYDGQPRRDGLISGREQDEKENRPGVGRKLLKKMRSMGQGGGGGGGFFGLKNHGRRQGYGGGRRRGSDDS